MKFFNYNTATVFDRPSVQGWLVVFVCGFLTMCIIVPVLCIAVWLFVMAIKVLHVFPSTAWDVPLLSTVRVMLQSPRPSGRCSRP